MYGQLHEPCAYFSSHAAMPNQHNLQVMSRSAQRRDECPAKCGMQVPHNRIGINTCIKSCLSKGHELDGESNLQASNVTPVTERAAENIFAKIYEKRAAKSIATRQRERVLAENEDLKKVVAQKVRSGSIECARRARKEVQHVAKSMQDKSRVKSKTCAKAVSEEKFQRAEVGAEACLEIAAPNLL